jgi:translation elongation factor EF-Ts
MMDAVTRRTIMCCLLQGMGFSRLKAKEALEECNYSMDQAVEWLVSNCV